MTNSLQYRGAITLAVVLVLGAVAARPAQAQTFTTLYSFGGGSDGAYPYSAVIQDTAGNLYGTTESGDSDYNYGVVFKLDTTGNETVLHSFLGRLDGDFPYPPVIRDSKGDIYGTTLLGQYGNPGTVFKIDSAGSYTNLHTFAGGTSDGCEPYQGLVMDKAGSLYGTTEGCGTSGMGTVFKVDSAGNETILHNFAGGSSDGAFPYYGHLLLDKAGDLYGVTYEGGSSKYYGVLYKLSKKGTLTVLHSFAGGISDGCYPLGTVTMDKAGNVYGNTLECGTSGFGIVWKVSKKGGETILHNFAGGKSDGCYPAAGVVRDSKGNLYGNTLSCGASGYYGSLWELHLKGKLTLLHSFAQSDGAFPYGDVLRTAKGTLYGTTYYGGCCFYGTVWKYKP
jgi:uncharacterized repeat protein (TIGR03803 family)